MQAIIRRLQSGWQEEISRADQERADMLEYYTLWVHQAKTPLAAMGLLLAGREDAAALEAERFKLERYVDMALQYARLGADASDFVLRECALAPIVRGAVRKYARLFIAKRIHLTVEEMDARVLTDDKWLSFAIEQLLSNAVKYTGENGHIRISLCEPLSLVIEDDGIGIQPEDLPRVFEKGYTGFNGRAGEKSTGIGLYLCKKTLERLSHTIRLESSPGSGTRAIVGLEVRRVPFD